MFAGVGGWLDQSVEHAVQALGCEFKSHVGHGAHFKKVFGVRVISGMATSLPTLWFLC